MAEGNQQRYFMRTYELIFGEPSKGKGLQLTGDEAKSKGYQLSFRIRKFLNNATSPNIAEIELDNLSEELINYLKKQAESVSLSVGYENNNLLLFSGNILEVESKPHKSGGSDKTTKITCTPSASFIHVVGVDKTFPAGTSVKNVIDYVVQTSPDLVQSTYNSSVISSKFPFGYTAHGTGKQIIDSLSKEFGFTYRVDKHRLVISDHDKYQAKNSKSQAFLLTWGTGLKTSPTYASPDGKTISLRPTKKKSTQEKLKEKHAGIKCTALINPLLVPGAAVKIQGTEHDGIYRISGSEFVGDWKSSNKWDVELFCTKID